ncbi:CbiX/SirB N-terminal domain-containing protein [Hydrogenophaga sp. 5NK40-0174]|uniref:sirohydrochlorin chelatase n=1 Tax=Hydrogenophaga sp. 5NK40-0174 TaxID=3127649 RepID=UPI00310ACE2A
MLGVVIFAHGSRDPMWRQPVEAVADAVRRRDPASRVRCAYLELSEPDLPTAAAQLVGEGCRQLRILPLFFGMGKHARTDLPALVSTLQRQFPAVNIQCLPAAGESERLAALLADIALNDEAQA